MSAPSPKEEVKSEEYTPAGVLERFDKLENLLTNTRQRVQIWQDTTSLTVIVIFVTVLGLAFSLIFFFIQTIRDDAKSRDQLTQSVIELKAEIHAQQLTRPSTKTK